MDLLFKIIVFVEFLVIGTFAQTTATPGLVISFKNEQLIYWGNHTTNSSTYGIVARDDNSIWHYKVNDTIFLDSTTVRISSIDTVNNTISYLEIPYVNKRGKSNEIGLMVDESFIGKNNIIALRNISKDSATFAICNLGYLKTYTFQNDTIILRGDSVVYLHITEENEPTVNCRDIIVKDTSIGTEVCAFYLRRNCSNDAIWIRGYFDSTTVKMYLTFGNNPEISETMFLTGTHLSCSRIIKQGENAVSPLDNSRIQLVWIQQNVTATAAGMIFNESTSSIKNMPSRNIEKRIAWNVGKFVNLKGQSMTTQNRQMLLIKSVKGEPQKVLLLHD